MTENKDYVFMAKAIAQAKVPVFSPHPNPRVGCVIVKDGAIIGQGHHEYAGGAHAEINALKQAGDKAKQSTVYVTLEPCNHFGKTPPCTDALIKAEVTNVVIAMQDPNPLVSGQGVEKLQAAGITVTVGVLEQQAKDCNKGYIKRMQTGMPWVCAKIAMSLDGKTAMASAESQWITGAEARRDVQLLRANTHAILTGSGTVIADDPRLTVRDIDSPEKIFRQPIRVVVDSKNKISESARIFSEDGLTLVATLESEKTNDRFIRFPQKKGKVCLQSLLKKLGENNINDVLVEAGPNLNGALLSEGLIDEVIIYMATDVMGHNANGLFNLPELKLMKDKISFHCHDIRKVGSDIRLTLTPIQDKQ